MKIVSRGGFISDYVLTAHLPHVVWIGETCESSCLKLCARAWSLVVSCVCQQDPGPCIQVNWSHDIKNLRESYFRRNHLFSWIPRFVFHLISRLHEDYVCNVDCLSLNQPHLNYKMSNERKFTHLKDLQSAQQTESTMSSDSKKQWEEKLVGKKITDDSLSSSSTVCPLLLLLGHRTHDNLTLLRTVHLFEEGPARET